MANCICIHIYLISLAKIISTRMRESIYIHFRMVHLRGVVLIKQQHILLRLTLECLLTPLKNMHLILFVNGRSICHNCLREYRWLLARTTIYWREIWHLYMLLGACLHRHWTTPSMRIMGWQLEAKLWMSRTLHIWILIKAVSDRLYTICVWSTHNDIIKNT